MDALDLKREAIALLQTVALGDPVKTEELEHFARGAARQSQSAARAATVLEGGPFALRRAVELAAVVAEE